MNKTRNILTTLLVSALIVLGVIIFAYEKSIWEAGILEPQSNSEFILTTLMEIITIIAVPLALRLFYFKKIKTILQQGKEKALLHWGVLRLLMLIIPLIANTLLYYMFGFSTTFAYLALILFVCLIFVIPTKKRCQSECFD